MRKFSARWWSGDSLRNWKMMSATGDFLGPFFQFEGVFEHMSRRDPIPFATFEPFAPLRAEDITNDMLEQSRLKNWRAWRGIQ
jgi:hypothetical protein